MIAKIRLQRFGAKKKPFYRIVVMGSENPRDGKSLDTIGTYDPMHKLVQVVLDEEKAGYWLKKGAQPTETVRSILKKKKLV
ncbi:MAG: 30S ribosomal protein S16 [bacterium]